MELIVFQYILSLINTLGKDKGVQAFRVSSLGQFSSLKSPNNPNVTFLQFVVENCPPSVKEYLCGRLYGLIKPAASAINGFQMLFPTILPDVISLAKDLEQSTNSLSEKEYYTNMNKFRLFVEDELAKLHQRLDKADKVRFSNL